MEVCTMQKLKFRDMKARKNFTTDKYQIVKKKNPRTKRITTFAKTTAPSGCKAFRIVPSGFKG